MTLDQTLYEQERPMVFESLSLSDAPPGAEILCMIMSKAAHVRVAVLERVCFVRLSATVPLRSVVPRTSFTLHA